MFRPSSNLRGLCIILCVNAGVCSEQLEDDAAFMDKYSRQIGAFGLEAMSKLMNLKVLIVGLR